MGDEVQTSTNSTDSAGASGVAHLLNHVKENPVAYMIGLLILQQMGWLSQATTQLSGVCF